MKTKQKAQIKALKEIIWKYENPEGEKFFSNCNCALCVLFVVKIVSVVNCENCILYSDTSYCFDFNSYDKIKECFLNDRTRNYIFQKLNYNETQLKNIKSEFKARVKTLRKILAMIESLSIKEFSEFELPEALYEE